MHLLTFIFNSASFSAHFWTRPRGRCAGKPLRFDTARREETGAASGRVAARTTSAANLKKNKIWGTPAPAKGSGRPQPSPRPCGSSGTGGTAGWSLFGQCCVTQEGAGQHQPRREHSAGNPQTPFCRAKQGIKIGNLPRAPQGKIKKIKKQENG